MEVNISKLRLNYGSINDPRLIFNEINNKQDMLFSSEEMSYLQRGKYT